MSLVGGTTTVPKLPSPEPHVDPSSTNKEDEAVTVVEMMLVEALRASAANKDADDQPAKPLTEGEPDEVEACQALVGESKEEMTIVRAIRAIEKRLVVDLKEPRLGAVRDDKGDGHDHDQDNHDQADHGHDDSHDDEALVARFVRSSLDIAVYRYSFDDNSKLV
jgi:hypothetical protein